jgi:hypothetical protein
MSEHPGLLGYISEASEIRQELGVSIDEAFAIQRDRAAERLREYVAQQPETQSNVIQFRPRGRHELQQHKSKL